MTERGKFDTSHTHGVGSNQFLSVNIGVIRLLSVITTTASSKNNVSLIIHLNVINVVPEEISEIKKIKKSKRKRFIHNCSSQR
jgi:hypothetical protein